MTIEIITFIIAIIYLLKDFGTKKNINKSILILTDEGQRIKEQWGYLTSVAAIKYSIDEKIIIGVIGVESDGNSQAIGKAGEIGLMQLLPSGALADYRKEMGFMGDAFLPAINIDAGTWYLKKIHQSFPLEQWIDKIQAYNVGIVGYKRGERNEVYSQRFSNYVSNLETFPEIV